MSGEADSSLGVTIGVCERCGHAVFPRRPVCPRCGAARWRTETVHEGVVENTTEARLPPREERHPAADEHPDADSVSVAEVRVEAGPVLIAGSPDRAARGARVQLETRSGAPVARLPAEDPR